MIAEMTPERVGLPVGHRVLFDMVHGVGMSFSDAANSYAERAGLNVKSWLRAISAPIEESRVKGAASKAETQLENCRAIIARLNAEIDEAVEATVDNLTTYRPLQGSVVGPLPALRAELSELKALQPRLTKAVAAAQETLAKFHEENPDLAELKAGRDEEIAITTGLLPASHRKFNLR